MTSPCRRNLCCTRQLWRGVTPQRLVVWHCTQPPISKLARDESFAPLPQQPALETPQRLETACHLPQQLCRNDAGNVRLWAEVPTHEKPSRTPSTTVHDVLNPRFDEC